MEGCLCQRMVDVHTIFPVISRGGKGAWPESDVRIRS